MSQNDQPAQPEQLQLFFSSPYLNIDQVAHLLSVPKSFIYRRTVRGHDDPIPHYRLGGHLRFKLADVENWVEKHRSEASQEPLAAPTAAALKARGPGARQTLKQVRRRRSAS